MTEKDLLSVRGLVDQDFGTPLRKFKGKLAEAVPSPARGYEGTRVDLNFKDVEALQSIEPYRFPTATLNLGLSNKKKSAWGYFSDSVAVIIPDSEDLKNQFGKDFLMVFCDGLEGRPAPKPLYRKDADVAKFPDKMVPTPVWIVLEIDGKSAGTTVGEASISTAVTEAESLLDGKTRAEFNKAAYENETIRKDKAFQRALADKSFIAAALGTGRFTEDENGVFHRIVGVL